MFFFLIELQKKKKKKKIKNIHWKICLFFGREYTMDKLLLRCHDTCDAQFLKLYEKYVRGRENALEINISYTSRQLLNTLYYPRRHWIEMNTNENNSGLQRNLTGSNGPMKNSFAPTIGYGNMNVTSFIISKAHINRDTIRKYQEMLSNGKNHVLSEDERFLVTAIDAIMQVQKEIISMLRGTFTRFQATEEYQMWLTHIQDNHTRISGSHSISIENEISSV
ncbi:hypothetical protein RFI_08763 [Reticulomyxa filosa]|uniref:Uncharacterized protein n=1 Tax=Reticulomyxa filosa TaxID=46433 RepID=X6NRP6_RETFI|nr:hypothetical protein RFI_08763 [Reticulomyxa filosa]|eukprot:ETO28369.1 hypothetical protein RFI_08763 [Reticulomyxa filosa]